MRLLSWNINGRVGDAARRQLEAVLVRNPDVIVLQEVTGKSYDVWAEALMGGEYSVISTLDLARLPHPGTRGSPEGTGLEGVPRIRPKTERRYFNLTAARDPVAVLPGLRFDDPQVAQLAFPEKYLALRVRREEGDIEIHNVHLPPGARVGAIKVYTFEAIRRRIDQRPRRQRILCGDFNAPLVEDDFGPDRSAQRRRRPDPLQTRWDDAEASVIEHPEFPDAYRTYREERGLEGPFPASHFTGRRRTPRRYDHIFASRDFEVRDCQYLSEWLEDELSDHAPIEAEVAFKFDTSA